MEWSSPCASRFWINMGRSSSRMSSRVFGGRWGNPGGGDPLLVVRRMGPIVLVLVCSLLGLSCLKHVGSSQSSLLSGPAPVLMAGHPMQQELSLNPLVAPEASSELTAATQAAKTKAHVAAQAPVLTSTTAAAASTTATPPAEPAATQMDGMGAIKAPVKDAFSRIYDNSAWGKEGRGSGRGSSLSLTERTREVLYNLTMEHKITSMADVPCGAMNWMPILLADIEKQVPGFQYFGGDIVPSVVKDNQERFREQHPNWTFQLFDITSATIPPGYEMVHCRDALQHLPLEMVVEALRNFAKSHARLLVLGSYSAEDGAQNKKIVAGDYFSINLRQEPFALDKPLAVFNEQTNRREPGEPDKYMLVYDVEYLRSIDFDAMDARVAVVRKRMRH